MNTKTKRRLVVVTGVIVVVLAIVLAVVGSGGAAKTVSVADALSGSYDSDRIQVSGNVVDNSFATEDNVLTSISTTPKAMRPRLCACATKAPRLPRSATASRPSARAS